MTKAAREHRLFRFELLASVAMLADVGDHIRRRVETRLIAMGHLPRQGYGFTEPEQHNDAIVTTFDRGDGQPRYKATARSNGSVYKVEVMELVA